jgi:hypothetical protein
MVVGASVMIPIFKAKSSHKEVLRRAGSFVKLRIVPSAGGRKAEAFDKRRFDPERSFLRLRATGLPRTNLRGHPKPAIQGHLKTGHE